ncbi:MAG: hypothetical protein IJI14_06165 [Anaerolineaceae bacterium]|nr:hypothetical protein [Anaerolineaceae bacterium]
MAEAEIFRAIREQREAINRSELKLLREMARLWVPTYRYLEEQLQRIVDTIEEKQANGEPIDMSWIYSLDRYQSMLDQSREAIDKYNKAAAQQISGAEADAVDIGVSNARQLVNEAEPDDPLWTRINQRETRIMAGQLSETSPLHTLLSRNWGETMSGIEKALTIGISTGQGSDWVARQMVEAANIPLKRALTIARTEVNRAYREATLETMRSSRAVIGYRRMCYPPTACFACLMMDGEFYDKASSFSDHPNGKCAAVPVTRHYDPINDDSWERGQDWFSKQDPETQRKIMGAGRFDLWQQGKVNLREMVYIKENPLWGGSPTMKTVAELKNIGSEKGIIQNATNTKRINRKITEQGDVMNPMDIKDYNRMRSALERKGIEVFAATEGDDLRYMLFLEAEGTYSNGRITHIGEIPSRGTFFEEIIHMTQSRKYGELDSTNPVELYAREIEANRKLLRYNKAYNLDALDVSDIERNLSIWEEKFFTASGINYDESNYRGNN